MSKAHIGRISYQNQLRLAISVETIKYKRSDDCIHMLT